MGQLSMDSFQLWGKYTQSKAYLTSCFYLIYFSDWLMTDSLFKRRMEVLMNLQRNLEVRTFAR